MKSLNLKLVGINSKFKPLVSIDGKLINLKKNKYGSYESNYETEKDAVEISVNRELELKSKLWWLYSLITFIISVFGILEPAYDRKCIMTDCKFNVKLNDTNDVKMRFNPLTSQGKAIELETQNEYSEEKNEYFVDKQVKKRRKISILFKVLVWIAIIILAIYFINKGI